VAKRHIAQISQPPTAQIWLPVSSGFSKAKIAVEKEELFESDGHTTHELSPRILSAGSLDSRESDFSRMHSRVSSDWLQSYISATLPVLEIFRIPGCFSDSPRKKGDFICCLFLSFV
jgi:hypothetical protein